MEKELKKNLIYYYLLLFLFESSRSCFFGIGSLFYTEQIQNFQLKDMYIIKMSTPIIIILLEIPTGIMADKVSRKVNFIISCIFCSLGFTSYFFSSKIIHCILSEILYSIGIAFQTGSIDALIISQFVNSNKNISNLLSRSSSIRSLALITGGTIGILLSFKNIRFIWLFGVLGMIATMIISFLIKEIIHIKKDTNKVKFNFNMLKNSSFISLTLINISLSLINAIFFNYWQQLVVKDLGIPRQSTNYIFIYFFYNFFVSLGSFIVSKVKKNFGIVKEIFIPLYLIIISTIVMAMTKNKIIALTFLMISELARGIQWPYFSKSYNRFTEDSYRSVFLSINSMTQRVTAFLSLGIFSYFNHLTGNKLGGKDIMLFSSLLAILISLISFPVFRKINSYSSPSES